MGNRRFRPWGAGEETGKVNKRVHNATKVLLEGGIKADSKLEAYMYEKLKRAGIAFEFHYPFVLIERFTWRGETVRAIKWSVDFYFPWCKMAIDTKGFVTDKADLKIKIWKSQHLDMELKLPSNKGECDSEFMYVLAKWVKYESSFGLLKPEDL